MDRNSSKPLTPDEAKARLRDAALRASPTGYLRGHPFQSMGLAMAAGIMAGRTRLSGTVILSLADQLLPLVARFIVRQQGPTSKKSQSEKQ